MFSLQGIQLPVGGYRGNGAGILGVHSDRTRDNRHKLQQGKFRLDIGKKIFAVRTGKHREQECRKAEKSPCLKTLRTQWDQGRGHPGPS